MKKQPPLSLNHSTSPPPMGNAAGEEDRISELPDEILLCILRRVKCYIESAQIAILSKRFRSICEPNPVVEFHPAIRSNRYIYFPQFVKSQMQRFSRNNGLRMEALKVRLGLNDHNLGAFEQLLDLALKRKAQELDINAQYAFSFRILSNSSVKNLRLRRIIFLEDDLPVIPLNSVRFLYLVDVKSRAGCLSLRKLLATIPLLETLEIEDNFFSLKKLYVPKLAHLKALQVSYSGDLEIEEIAAPGLETLRLSNGHSRRSVCLRGLPAVLSSLQSLKSLTLELVRDKSIKQVKFSGPKLEEFTLQAPSNLEEIEVDAGSSFVKFYLYINDRDTLDSLKKCEIRNAAANCRWEAYCYGHLERIWVEKFKDFVSRFNNKFEAINLRPPDEEFK
ncbi:FBD-associated F-box protein At3g52670 [Linum grandiflorum]